MLLRILLLFLFCTPFHLQINAVGTHPTNPPISISENKPTPQKNGILKRLRNSILSKKIEKFIEKYDIQKCDIIILKNGDQFDVKVVQVTDEEVQYIDCDEDEGAPVKTYTVQEVEKIKFANNEMLVYEKNKLVKSEYKEPNTKGGFLVGLILGFFLNLLGLLIILLAFQGKRRRNAIIGALVGMLAIILFLFWSLMNI